jgi:uncharacterized phage protein (TIGR01671 family)
MKEMKFKVYSKQWGMSEPCSVFDIATMDAEGLTDMSQAEIIPFTTRRDRNGKEIYDGDIIRAACGGSPICKIEYTGTGFVPLQRSKLGGWVRLSWMYVVNGEVIGNIFENPDLLKEAP